MAMIINNHTDNAKIQRNKEFSPQNIHRVIINTLECLV